MYIPFEFNWLGVLGLVPFIFIGMATGQTTTTQIPSALTEIFDKALLMRAVAKQIHHLFLDVKPFSKRQGNTIKMRRYEALESTVTTTAATEGITGDPLQMSKTDITAVLQPYIRHVELTDEMIEENVENVIAEANTLLGENMGDVIDLVIRDVLIGGTTIRRGNGVGARTSIITAISLADIRSVVNTLERNNAKKLTQIIKASDKIGTSPVREGYFAICHPDVKYDIQLLTGFKSVAEYGTVPEGGLMKGEFGAIEEVRFLSTTNAKIWVDAGGAKGSLRSAAGTSADIYATLVFAQHSGTVVPLQGNGGKKMGDTSVKMIYHPLGWGDDPGEQRATVAAKCKTVAKITNDNFIVRIETGATSI